MNEAFLEVTGYATKIKPETFDLSVLNITGNHDAHWVTRPDGTVERDGRIEGKTTGFSRALSGSTAWEMLVDAAENDAQKAVLYMIADKLPDLVSKQVEAVKNLKIDKVTVWDTMSGGADGKTPATANFFSGLLKSIPPL